MSDQRLRPTTSRIRTSEDALVDPFQLGDSDDLDSDSDHEPVLSPTPPQPTPQQSRPSFLRNDSVDSANTYQDEDDVPLGSPLPRNQPASIAAPQATLPPGIPQLIVTSPPVPLIAPREDESPALYLPGLISPSLFLPIPNTDQLSGLLNRHIPPDIRPARDLSGAWENEDYHTLVMTNSWRALARMARDRIVSSSPDDSALIFELWFLRLNGLARLRLFNQASTECTNLFTVLSNVQPALVRTYLFEEVVPFELEVMRARTRYWNSDIYGYLDELAFLLRKCKKKSRGARNNTDVEMWKERAIRIGLILASQFIEMKDHAAAANILRPLTEGNPSNPPTPAILSAVARIYIDAGDLDSAATLFRKAEADPRCDLTTKEFNRSLQASARLDWPAVTENLKSILAREPENLLAANNISVALLSMGYLEDAIRYLEGTLRFSPSLVAASEPFLFNLATLYELRTAASLDKKRELLVEIAKWAGDGLRASCLKLPTA